MTTPNVAIVGGGIGGLTAAIALDRAGFDVTVYERRAESVEAGAGITLWPDALAVLGTLGVSDGVLGHAAVLAHPHLSDKSGRPLPDSQWANVSGAAHDRSGSPICIHRAVLLQLLLTAFGEERVRHGAELVALDRSDEDVVRMQFADGSVAPASVVIGADGVHSTIRSQLFPQVTAVYGGQTVYRGIAPLADGLVGREPFVAIDEGLRFGWEPLPDRTVYWFAGRFQPEFLPDADAGRKAFLLDTFDGWLPEIHQLIEETPAERILRNDVYVVGPLDRIVDGRVALLGDAAHTIPPHAGAGACLAIEDAGDLARALRDCPDVPQALDAYEKARSDTTSVRFARADRMRGELERGDYSPIPTGTGGSRRDLT